MSKESDNAILEFLQSIRCCTPLFPNNFNSVVSVSMSETLPELFKRLIDSKILSVPVKDSEGKVVSIISMIDLLDEFVDAFPEEDLVALNSLKTWEFFFHFSTLKEKKAEVEHERVAELLKKEVSKISRLDPVPSITDDASLLDAAKLMISKKAHRVLVAEKASGRLSNVITQSRLIEFFGPLLESIPESQKTIQELGMGLKDVITINFNKTAIQAFKLMKDHSISAIAVVNDQGELVGNISVNDLKLLGYDLKYFEFLEVPVKQYLHMVNQAETLQHSKSIRSEVLLRRMKENGDTPVVISCRKEDTLGMVIKNMVYYKIHRIYVTENKKPIGVVSQSDIIKQIIGSRVSE